MIKRYAVAAGVGSLVFAAALGSASALGIDPGVAQSGTESLRGDSDGVQVTSYIYEQDNNSSYGAVIEDVSSDLVGQNLYAFIYDGAGNEIGRGEKEVTGSKVSVRWDTAPVDVEQIESIRLTITD